MKLWFTRDDHNGDWNLWFESPQPRDEGIKDETRMAYTTNAMTYTDDIADFARILGLEIEPGEALLVDVRARMIEGSLGAIERHSDLASWDQVLEDVDDE